MKMIQWCSKYACPCNELGHYIQDPDCDEECGDCEQMEDIDLDLKSPAEECP